MADFCRQNEFAYTTMLDWINADSSRAEMYARAREDRSDKLADEIVSISDECEYAPITDMSGKTIAVAFDKTAVARNKLRVDARKWLHPSSSRASMATRCRSRGLSTTR
jgi:hypothetical protein